MPEHVVITSLEAAAAAPITIGPMWQEPTARVAWPEFIAVGSTGTVVARPVLRDQSPDGVTPGTVDYPIWLPAGTYRATVEALIGTVNGINEVLLNGATFGTFDTYLATGYPAQAFRPATAVVVATTGVHTFTIRKTGTKNASATGYIFMFVAAHLRKTA